MKLKLTHFLPGIAWFFIVMGLLLIPGSDLPKTDNWLKKIYFDKWIHAALFGMLAHLFMQPVHKSNLAKSLKWNLVCVIGIVTSIWGLCTEFIQESFVKGRAFEWLDWAADTTGAIIAFGIRYFYLQKIK